MIVHRSGKRRPSKGKTQNLEGFMPSVKRRVEERAKTGLAPAGKHRGGPCPAVTLATLAGISYGEASHLLRKHGFTGRGLRVGEVDVEIRRVCKRPSREVTAALPVATVVRRHFAGRDGWIRCKGHVMPVVDGELLYASPKHARMTCTGAFVFTD